MQEGEAADVCSAFLVRSSVTICFEEEREKRWEQRRKEREVPIKACQTLRSK
jgi:hypothetical protein